MSFDFGVSRNFPPVDGEAKDGSGAWYGEDYERTCQPPDRNSHDSILFD